VVTSITTPGIRHHRPVSVPRKRITPTTAQVRREAPGLDAAQQGPVCDLRRGSGAGLELRTVLAAKRAAN
ncbi:MAG TPA: hypothetical protein VLC51_07135, partial [Nitrospira sp.]|nr:hypothetical protein [Nitrospira sp.]